MNYIGDFAEDSTVYVVLTTNDGNGAAVAPSSAFEAADFRVYKNGSATQKTSTNGITISSPFDSVTGLHILSIDTSNDTGDAGFWTTAADYWVVAVPDETVDGQSVVSVIAAFSIENRLRVKASDEVSANVTKISGDSTAADNAESFFDGTGYAGTNNVIPTVTSVTNRVTANTDQIAGASVSTSTAQIGVNVVNAGGTAWGSGAITASSIASNAITSAKIATDAIGAAQIAANAIGSSEIADGAITAAKIASDAITDAKVASDVTIASVTGAVGSVTSGVTVTTNNDKTGYALSTAGIAAIWNALTSGLTTVGSIGKLLVDNINATISSRASQTSVDTIDDYVDTEIAAIKTVVDNIEVDTQNIQSRLPTSLVFGRIDASVGAMASSVITATSIASSAITSAKIATDAITSTQLAASAVTEIQTGLSTLDAAGVRSAIGLASANLDTQLAAIDDYVDTEVAAIKTVTDKLDTAMELDGAVYRFTTNALEQAPSGGGGTADWTSDERTAIRSILGIPVSGTTPTDPTSGILDTIRDKVDVVDDYIDTEIAAIKTVVDAIEVDTQNIQSRLPTSLVSGRIDASVGAMATSVITASAIASDAITDAKVASDVTIASVTGSVGSVTSAVTVGTNNDKTGYSLTSGTGLGNQTANITGNLSGSVGSVTGNVGGNVAGSVGSVTAAVTVGTNNDKTGYGLSTAAIQAIWDALTSALTSVGSIGKLLVDNVNATISSRATQTSVDTIDDYLDTEIAAIKAKTDNLPSDPADASDIAAAFVTVNSKLDAIDDFVDTEVSAIKTVTDKLDTAMELDGLVYRFTTNALEQAPSGGGGGTTDWTSDERTAIRSILGIPGSGTTPTDPTSGILDTIRDKVDAVDDYVDTEIAAIKTVVDAIEVDTQDIQGRLPAALVSGRIDASVGNMESNVITSSVIATGAITASAIQTNAITDDKLAASAITEIQSGLATSAGVTAAFTEIKGTGWSSATDTLEEIRDAVDAGGGGSTVVVSPLSALAPERVNGTTISVAVGDLTPVTIDVYDANDAAVNLSTQGDLEVCIESRDNVDLQVVAHASITISGASSNKATWTPNAAAVGTVDKHRWSLRTAAAKKVLAYGPWVVERVALSDV